jgi:hypothetical protein
MYHDTKYSAHNRKADQIAALGDLRPRSSLNSVRIVFSPSIPMHRHPEKPDFTRGPLPGQAVNRRYRFAMPEVSHGERL